MANPHSILQHLAENVGLSLSWLDVFGQHHQVSDDTLRHLLIALDFPCESDAQIQNSLDALREAQRMENTALADSLLIVDVDQPLMLRGQGAMPYRLWLESGEMRDGIARHVGSELISVPPIHEPGYHRLALGSTCLQLAVCPTHCPPVAGRNASPERPWGIAAQVYSLSATREPLYPAWGKAGDFASLAEFSARAGRAGADAVVISPVHALFCASPDRYSPYAPSSRLFLNTAYAEPALVCGKEAMGRALAGLDAGHHALGDTIDWPVVIPARLAILRRLFDQRDTLLSPALKQDLDSFRHEGGDALAHHACYEALHAAHDALGPGRGWQDWPQALHDPSGVAVQQFAQSHRTEVDLQVFQQWLADRGLRQAQRAARAHGMSIGLIADLAIGTDPRGSHAWSRQTEVLQHVSIGAPPDLFQPQGQNWGITAFSASALQRTGYAAFIETLRANLRHAGGLRIDHIMGLARMWLIPSGAQAKEGAYLRYPLNDMLRLTMLEAWRHKAIIIGENLGTVAPGFNDTLRSKGILGTSVLWFQQQANWPDWTMATTTTHDLPTIEGWWRGQDIQWRVQAGQLTDDQATAQRESRAIDKTTLAQTIGALPYEPDSAPRQEILAYVAATPGPLVIIPAEDLLGVVEQPNLPGVDVSLAASSAAGPQHPSWRQTLPVSVEQFFTCPEVKTSLNSIKQGRAHSCLAAPQDNTPSCIPPST